MSLTQDPHGFSFLEVFRIQIEPIADCNSCEYTTLPQKGFWVFFTSFVYSLYIFFFCYCPFTLFSCDTVALRTRLHQLLQLIRGAHSGCQQRFRGQWSDSEMIFWLQKSYFKGYVSQFGRVCRIFSWRKPSLGDLHWRIHFKVYIC